MQDRSHTFINFIIFINKIIIHEYIIAVLYFKLETLKITNESAIFQFHYNWNYFRITPNLHKKGIKLNLIKKVFKQIL